MAVDALNWCASSVLGAVGVDPGIHDDVARHVEGRVLDRGVPLDRQNKEAAARELLRAKWGYHVGASTVEPFRRESVSLPELDNNAPWLVDVLPACDRDLLLDVKGKMMKDVAETMESSDHGVPIKPYMDEGLARDKVLYRDFVLELHERGLVSFTRRPKSECTLFFVAKKGGKQRMIVDARKVNSLFRAPPSVALTSPEHFSELELSGDRMFQATADISNYFYRLRIDRSLGGYFALPGICASELGFVHFEGNMIRPSDRVYPYLTVLPMGFSWSVWFAQRACVHQVRLGPTLGSSTQLKGE